MKRKSVSVTDSMVIMLCITLESLTVTDTFKTHLETPSIMSVFALNVVYLLFHTAQQQYCNRYAT